MARLRCTMRPGRKVPVTIYIQMGEEPADSDPAVCTVPYPLLAQLLCDGVNAQPGARAVLVAMGADLVARQVAFPAEDRAVPVGYPGG